MSRKKYSQKYSKGCRLCGDPTVGRGIRQHIVGAHPKVPYEAYKEIFSDRGVIVDELYPTDVTVSGGKKQVVMHVLVRRFTIPLRG